jgi:hypothetical protein
MIVLKRNQGRALDSLHEKDAAPLGLFSACHEIGNAQ